jgi:hypothetical protein
VVKTITRTRKTGIPVILALAVTAVIAIALFGGGLEWPDESAKPSPPPAGPQQGYIQLFGDWSRGAASIEYNPYSVSPPLIQKRVPHRPDLGWQSKLFNYYGGDAIIRVTWPGFLEGHPPDPNNFITCNIQISDMHHVVIANHPQKLLLREHPGTVADYLECSTAF